MLPALRTPQVLTDLDGSLSRIVWSVPTKYIPLVTKLVWEEAGITLTAKLISAEDSLVSIVYTPSKASFVVFACRLFKDHYEGCRVAEAMYFQKELNPNGDEIIGL